MDFTRRAFLVQSALLSLRFAIPGDGGGIFDPPKHQPSVTVDMIPFLLPYQSYSDARQFHTTGYMLYNQPGKPPRIDGGFMKIAQIAPKEGEFKYPNEYARYILQKAPHKPCEYSFVLKETDDNDKETLVSYLKTEMMDWGTNGPNGGSRNYPLGNGYPFFEWGRSNALKYALNMQNTPRCDWDYCGANPNESELLTFPSGYIVKGPYDLETNLDAIVQDLGTLGSHHPLSPANETLSQLISFRDMIYSLGLKKPKLLTIGGYWGMADSRFPFTETNAWNRERYDYVAGEDDIMVDGKLKTVLRSAGHVGWHWQIRLDDDLRKDFVTTQEGISATVIYENAPVLPLMPCEIPTPNVRASLSNLENTSENPYLFAAMSRNRWRKQPMDYSVR